MKDEQRLKECVREFFNNYLNYTEESDSGCLFQPITISCGRVMKMKPLEDLLMEMQQLSGSEPLRKNLK